MLSARAPKEDTGEDYGPLGMKLNKARSPALSILSHGRVRTLMSNGVPPLNKLRQKEGSNSKVRMRASQPYHFSLLNGAPSIHGKMPALQQTDESYYYSSGSRNPNSDLRKSL